MKKLNRYSDWFDKNQANEAYQKEYAEAVARKVYRSREEFAKDYPDNKWIEYLKPNEILIPVMERYTCIKPGWYAADIMKPIPQEVVDKASYLKGYVPSWDVTVNDGDDGYLRKKCKTEQEAKDSIEMLISFAPASFGEIVYMGVGFKWD